MKVQLIGLPCSGKTTVIKEFLKKNKNIHHLDIRDFQGKDKVKAYKRKLEMSSGPLIAESACGVNVSYTEIVRLQIPNSIIYKRSLIRDNFLDEDYFSLLETQMIPAKYTVRNPETLIELLNNLFYG